MKPVAILSTFAVVLFSPLVGAQQTEKPAEPETAPAKPPPPEPKPVMAGPTRELKLADNTWMRFLFQVQAWYRVAQDAAKQQDGSDGGYALDLYCRRCRLAATGSIVKDVTFNILFEALNLGRANAATGDKGFVSGFVPLTPTVNMLDAYGMVRFVDGFQLMAGSMVVPMTRNGNQPTTTYLSLDVANTSIVTYAVPGQPNPATGGPVLNVLRDLGVQAVGYLADDHLEYRLGAFQGLRSQASTGRSASHNMPLINAMLQYNFWDTEKGYVWGGHYYGAKKVLGLFAAGQYQKLGKADAPFAGTEKNPLIGVSGAAFINYPLSGKGDPKGGDEIVALAQVGYLDGGTDPNDATKVASWDRILKQIDYLGEAAYYNKDAKISVFGKFEYQKYSSDFGALTQIGGFANKMWIAGGLKYYLAPANLCNIGIQYERLIFPDAPSTAQNGTNTITTQFQFLLY